jgi:CRP-like cAMP-binding protein
MSAPRGRPGPGANRLLTILPPASLERLVPHLKTVQLELGHTILSQNDSFEHAHFPTSAVLSLVVRMEDGRSVEAAPVGFEGVSGVAVVLGESQSECEITVQGAGEALQISVPNLLKVAASDPDVRDVLLRYAQVQMVQAARSAACNRLHELHERLARWLLHMHDWMWGERIRLTQEFLAIMLGVRRASVTVAAGTLQNAGLISYQRGEITMVDRAGLEAVTCEDYFAIRQAFDRLLPLPAS